jgi:hypothetical protein
MQPVPTQAVAHPEACYAILPRPRSNRLWN